MNEAAKPDTTQASAMEAPREALPALRERRDLRWRVPMLGVLLVVLIFLGWQLLDTRNELRSVREDVSRRLGEGDAVGHEAGLSARNAQEIAQGMQARVSALENRMAEEAGQRAALEKLYQDTSRSRDERSLQEAEQAISIAAQQLQLGGNVRAAMTALQAADASLALADQGRTLNLRRLIARDLDRLKSLPLADVGGMSLQLDAMLGRIDGLPLAYERSPAVTPVASPVKPVAKAVVKAGPRKGVASSASAPQATETTQSQPGVLDALSAVGNDFWQGFRQLVRVERLDKPEAALLAPDQVGYLRENIRLRLLSARLALLQRDGRVFAEDVMQARLSLQRYFDAEAKPVASLIEELRQMESARLVVDLPDLSETLVAARRLRSVR